MIISLLLRLKAFRPWKDTLGQYCLLGKHGRKSRFRNCLHYATLGLVDKAKKRGRKSSVKLLEDVKEAIVHSLLQTGRNGQLMSGVTSPLNPVLYGEVTRTIVVWHITTTLCWTAGSSWMYLVAFAPNLLPDNIFISESILDKAINEADKLLKKHRKLDKRCRILMTRYRKLSALSDDAPLLTQGAQLARCLMSDKYEATLRWKVLSDFWAGMMLYVSRSVR
ncbi:hypothetical protein U9M48_000462 [Paspalum notatum var. saurae]|uniref:Uncharacterized protein n=1 Tax=Paspalum notatum var. saurae TaxID=547442 RepID=A0AAQ3SEK9_PASNO